jgi:putative tryptophan/tyrosine transport system substrate-binding protein
MKRRELILGGGLTFAWPLAGRAQPSGKRYRIAVIHPFLPVESMNDVAGPLDYGPFFEELRRLGYAEGQNLVVERYSGLGKSPRQQMADLLQSVAAAKPDAMFVVAMDVAVGTTRVPIPIVHIGLDPIGFGITTNLAHPDHNITGVAIIAGREIYAKHLELLREAIPKASRIGCLTIPQLWGETGANTLGPLREAAKREGLDLIPALIDAPYPDDAYRRAFAAMTENRTDALIVTQAIQNYAHQALIVELAASARLPAIYPQRNFVDQGGLMSYGSSLGEAYHSAASDIAELPAGAKPSDIPFYQATRFELVVNLKTANTLGLALPQILFARADEVIE